VAGNEGGGEEQGKQSREREEEEEEKSERGGVGVSRVNPPFFFLFSVFCVVKR